METISFAFQSYSCFLSWRLKTLKNVFDSIKFIAVACFPLVFVCSETHLGDTQFLVTICVRYNHSHTNLYSKLWVVRLFRVAWQSAHIHIWRGWSLVCERYSYSVAGFESVYQIWDPFLKLGQLGRNSSWQSMVARSATVMLSVRLFKDCIFSRRSPVILKCPVSRLL